MTPRTARPLTRCRRSSARLQFDGGRAQEFLADLAINFLGPCALVCACVNSSQKRYCSTYTNPTCRWSLRAQKCNPTCPTPATGPSSTHSEPGNTSRQIHKIHTVKHVPIAPLARVLGGSTLKSGPRAPPLPHTRRAAPTPEHRGRQLVLEEPAREEELLEAGAGCCPSRAAAPPNWPPPATMRAALSAWR